MISGLNVATFREEEFFLSLETASLIPSSTAF
jgi:hypothetical protein